MFNLLHWQCLQGYCWPGYGLRCSGFGLDLWPVIMFLATLKSHSEANTAPRSPPRIAPASTLGRSSWFWFSFSFPRFRFGLKMSPRLKRTDEKDCQLSKRSEEGVTHIDIAQEPGRWQGGRRTSYQARRGPVLGPHHSPVTPSMYYDNGSLFLRLSERSKAKALLVPCSPSISDIQVSQWIMRQYMGIPATASEARTCPDCRQCWRWNWEFQGGAPQATLGFTSGRLPASQFGERGECPTLAMTIITVNLFCSNSETLCFSEVFGVHRYNLLFWIGEKNVTKPP